MELDDLCVAAGWRDGVVSVIFRQQDPLSLSVGGSLAIAASEDRYCVGWRSPESGKATPCPDEAVTKGSSQCEACLRREVIVPCHRCTGERCGNPARREKCIQPDNHEIYLAFFRPGLIKVGVARSERINDRVAEQSSRAAISIGQADGKEIRNMEYHCRHIGYVDRVSLSTKLDAWAVPAQREAMYAELEKAADAIRSRLSGSWYKKARRIDDVGDFPSLVKRPRQLVHMAGLRLRGTIEGIYGNLVVVLSDSGDNVAFESASLVGYRLRQLAPDEVGQGQMALAI